MERLTDVNMGIYTSFRTGGNADCMLIPDTPEELAEILEKSPLTRKNREA